MSDEREEPRGGSGSTFDASPRPYDLLNGVRSVRDGATAPRATAVARQALGDALSAPFPEGEIRVVTLPVSAGRAEGLLRLGDDEPALFWDSASGPAFAGWGAAAVVEGEGEDRFAAVRAGAARLWPRIRSVAAAGAAPLRPRLFGGLAFLPGAPPAPWAPFGDARFVLPRLLFAADDAGGRLAVAVTAADAGGAARVRLFELIDRAVQALAGGAGPDPADLDLGPLEAVGGTAPEEWQAAVASIRARVETGRAEKIVAARVRELALRGPADAAAVLRRLRAATAAEARFAFRFGGATFLGATPERLVSRRGLEIRTEALAGSIDADRADRAEELLASGKDAAEHAYVVRAIAAALEGLCDRLEYPAMPRIQRLRHVLHLQTPFTGRLRGPVHVLDLVERLHPTPAVGGTPTGEAMAWIARHEPVARGWYAAPVGWFDEEQDGEFVVALRSALLADGRARLYAGAGIVRGSDADAELAETEVKLRTMADALGPAP